MGWSDVDLSTVNPNFDPIGKGDYVFRLRKARYREADPSTIEASATIVSDGEFVGRTAFFSYPDPTEYSWSPKYLKRLELAMGIDALPGEDKVAYLNRAAADGATFGATITHRMYVPEGTSEPVPRDQLVLSTVRPAVA